jgi:hypothetical protein
VNDCFPGSLQNVKRSRTGYRKKFSRENCNIITPSRETTVYNINITEGLKMGIRDLVEMISQLIARCLSEERFTGKIIITVHCRDGGIGRATSNIERDFIKYNPPEIFRSAKFEPDKK